MQSINHLCQMNDAVKYPRTPHLPWSPGGTSDDAYLFDTRHFEGKEVVITEKMDGENTSLYRNQLHARSIDGRSHPSRDWVKGLHATICSEIPEGWRLCGENVYARHSITYNDLKSYFYLFSIWNDSNCALSWVETLEWAAMLGLEVVPELYRGVWDQSGAEALAGSLDLEHQEGYVVRLAESFPFDEFDVSLAKWVRSGHVQTDQHWMFAEVIPNGLSNSAGEEEK